MFLKGFKSCSELRVDTVVMLAHNILANTDRKALYLIFPGLYSKWCFQFYLIQLKIS